MLAELAELDLSLARRVHAQAMAATDAEALNGLGRTYHRVARSLRQTLALKARLARERQKALLEDRAEAERDLEARVFRHKAQVRAAVEGRVCAEVEREDLDFLMMEVDERLEALTLEEGFLDAAIGNLADRIHAVLDVAGYVAGGKAGWPSAPEPGKPHDWRSSG
jgi:hypothetical protein